MDDDQVPSPQSPIPVEPTRYDVLCGAGHETTYHPGNVKFRLLVSKHFDKYRAAQCKKAKMKVSRAILAEVLATGARFLKKNPARTVWHVADIKVGKDKISHCLRSLRTSHQLAHDEELDDDYDHEHHHGRNNHYDEDPGPYHNRFADRNTSSSPPGMPPSRKRHRPLLSVPESSSSTTVPPPPTATAPTDARSQVDYPTPTFDPNVLIKPIPLHRVAAIPDDESSIASSSRGPPQPTRRHRQGPDDAIAGPYLPEQQHQRQQSPYWNAPYYHDRHYYSSHAPHHSYGPPSTMTMPPTGYGGYAADTAVAGSSSERQVDYGHADERGSSHAAAASAVEVRHHYQYPTQQPIRPSPLPEPLSVDTHTYHHPVITEAGSSNDSGATYDPYPSYRHDAGSQIPVSSGGKPSSLPSHHYNPSDPSHPPYAAYPVQQQQQHYQQHHREWNNQSSLSARRRFDTPSASTVTSTTTGEDVQDHTTLEYQPGGQQPHAVAVHPYSRHEYRASSRRGGSGATGGGHGVDYRHYNPYYQSASRTPHSLYQDSARSNPYYYPPPPPPHAATAAYTYPYQHSTNNTNNNPAATTGSPLTPIPNHQHHHHPTDNAGSTRRSSFWDDGWDEFNTNDPPSSHHHNRHDDQQSMSVPQSASNNVNHNSTNQKRSWSQTDNSSLDKSRPL
ncbi:hypothetical protein MHU86_8844 [Fragilaria crotonensis]|nr:hypothetical protein MHU86_8844 [Fragilaria crotonensis]